MHLRSSLLVISAALAVQACGSSNKCAPEPASPVSAPTATATATAPAPTHTAPAATASNAMKVETPSSTGHGTGDSTLRVEIAKDGTLSIEGSRLNDPRELTDRTKASARVRPDLQVVIAADRDVPYANVVNAIDLVKQAGVGKIAFEIDAAAPSGATPPQARSVPTLEPGEAWKCHYAGHIDHPEHVSVFVAIHVGPDGKPQTVDVLEEPAPGLGDAARICAMNHTFVPAHDAAGQPVPGVMKLRVSFSH
jgi:biopolymer transport protein ExbD